MSLSLPEHAAHLIDAQTYPRDVRCAACGVVVAVREALTVTVEGGALWICPRCAETP